MNRTKSALTAVAALAAFAGAGAAATPAQAASCPREMGQKYMCEFGVAKTKLANGTTQEFVVGTDHAVWTNWTRSDGSWNGWESLDGWVNSPINVEPQQGDSDSVIHMGGTGKDGHFWMRVRYPNGSWSHWFSCFVNPTNECA
ncbi:hypothetical protein ACJ6WE_39060 [Streptomyces sp. MMS24-I31]|uniref:hypothetical protein n=1 Tax=Streptomyces sp. MMS24-I31 TaxID=3351563 RepID=UPI0038969518